MRRKLQIIDLLYATAVIACSLATFGNAAGMVIAGFVLVFWGVFFFNPTPSTFVEYVVIVMIGLILLGLLLPAT